MSSTLEQRRAIYSRSAVAINQRELSKFRAETNDYFCRHEEELMALIQKIPNWQTYLTDKQLQVVQLYVSNPNTCAIDTQLKLANGVSWHTLFGTVKDNKSTGGVLKKLKSVQKKLDDIAKKKRRTK